jgi:HPt (histidine-containing phosphotransfer) domain-containing protein
MKEIENQEKIQNSIHIHTLHEILRIADFNTPVDALQFLFETIDCYLEEAPKLLQDVHTYYNQANYKALRRATHTLSSTSATLGAVNLATLCTELEIMIVNETLTDVTEQIYKMETEYQQVEIALEYERKKYQN